MRGHGALSGAPALARGVSAVIVVLSLAAPGAAQTRQGTPEAAPGLVELTLPEALERAASASPRLDEIRALLEAARAGVEEARAGRLPEVGLHAGYSRLSDVPELRIRAGDELRTIFPNVPNDWLLRLSASLPLYTGGRVEGEIRSAEHALAAGRHELRADRESLAFATTTAWWELVLQERREATLDEALASFEAHLGEARDRLAVGLAAPNEPMAVEVELERARLERLRAQGAREVAEDALAALLDLSPGTRIRPVAPDLDAPPAAGDLDALVGEALDRRPERQALQERVTQAQAGVDVAAAAGKPRVSLDASFDYANPNRRIVPPEPDFDTSWQVGIAVDLDLFDGGRRASRREAAAAEVQAVRARLAQLDRAIRGEVVEAAYELRTGTAAVGVAEHAVEAARESLRVAVDRHREGVSPSSERLDAETALLRARQELTGARIAAILARARLDHALGRPALPEAASAAAAGERRP